MKMHKTEYSGRILRGRAAMLRPIKYQSVGVWTSSGLRFTYVHSRTLDNVVIYSFVHPFIAYSLLRQVHSLFQSDFSRERDPVLHLSIENIATLYAIPTCAASSGMWLMCKSATSVALEKRSVGLICVWPCIINVGKGKAVPLKAWGGPEGSRKLRFPDFMTTAQDGGKVVSLTHRPPLPLGNTPGTHFC